MFDKCTDIPVVFARAEDIDEWCPGLLSVGVLQPVLLPFLAQSTTLLGKLSLLPGLRELSRAVSQLGRKPEILSQGGLRPTPSKEDSAHPAVLRPSVRGMRRL